jgi:quercetin dioxygenase-like cupin family protein
MKHGVNNMEHETEKSAKNTFVAKATKMADLVMYQKDAIVSRTLIDKDVGTVTLFAFDETQGLSEHTAPFDALVYILDGEVEAVIEGKSIRLKKDEMTIMPANKPHAVKAVSKFKMLLIMIRE